MNSLTYLFEVILNENPNQAIKFLKDKGMDPSTDPKGQQILELINQFTKGDGYTYLMTKFYVQERKPLEELQKLHEYIKYNKDYLARLPKPILTYETSRELSNDISELENERTLKKFLNQLSPQLREQFQQLDIRKKLLLRVLSSQFSELKPEKQKHFMKKVFGYKDINLLIENIKRYIHDVLSEQDYEATKEKIISTPDAFLVYDNPDKDILIAHINSFEAMKTLGCTSAWCIARDIARYRQYKIGGKYYFMIWDYNYPVDNPSFFIATAFNPSSPNTSATHEHINDSPLKLGEKLFEKDLSYDILEKYVKEYKSKVKEQHSSATGLMKALRDGDTDSIIDLLMDSSLLSEFNNFDPTVTYSGDEIELGLNEGDMIELLDLGYDYASIAATAEYSYNDYYDSSEADYMEAGLNDTNVALLIDLSKKIGANDHEKSDRDKPNYNEHWIRDFLNKYGMDDLIDLYVSEYSDAQASAEQRQAQELVNKVPFKADRGSFKIETLFEYYVENNLTAKTFDELIQQIKPLLPEFSWDNLAEARYNDLDLDQLNNNFREKLENIVEAIENDEDHPLYEKAKVIRDTSEYLKKLGFKESTTNRHNSMFEMNTDNMAINIREIYSDQNEDGSERVMIKASLLRKYYNDDNRWININIPLKSLINYINQYDIPGLRESLSLINIFKTII